MHIHKKRALIIILLGALTCYLMGMATERLWAWWNRPPMVQSETEVTGVIPVIEITGLENTLLTGRLLHKDVRIAIGDDVWHYRPGEWQISLSSIKETEKEILTGKPYTAQKGGRYFYPSESQEALRIPSDQRVYFSSPSEATTAGYIRGNRSVP